MGRIIKRIQRSAYEGGYYKRRSARSKFSLGSGHNTEAIKEERRLASEHREKTRVQSRCRRFMGAVARIFRRQER